MRHPYRNLMWLSVSERNNYVNNEPIHGPDQSRVGTIGAQGPSGP